MPAVTTNAAASAKSNECAKIAQTSGLCQVQTWPRSGCVGLRTTLDS
jgi:hypothetical protein